MKNFVKKTVSLVLAAIMIMGTGIKPVFASETEDRSLEDIIRPQIEAFAKSIDQPNADKKAADAIATHGMFGRGKDLKVGEDHALTATLVNSELAKENLTKLCTDLIKIMNELNTDKLYCLGGINYYKSSKSFHNKIYTYNAKAPSVYESGPSDFIEYKKYKYSKEIYKYDESLEWMAGVVDTDIDIRVLKVNKDKIVYKIDAIIIDCFDFSTSNGSGFKDFISGIGALLFREFYWYSTFDFQIEVPNDCEHSFGDWKVAAEPDCTEKGREERTCKNCGCVDTKSTAALGHSFGDWYETKAPTYFEEGEEQRSCSDCGAVESRSVAALEYLLGDVNGDERINVLDANLVRKYAAKMVDFDAKQFAAGDVNGDGKVNVLDANLIRKFAAKIIDSFPIA